MLEWEDVTPPRLTGKIYQIKNDYVTIRLIQHTDDLNWNMYSNFPDITHIRLIASSLLIAQMEAINIAKNYATKVLDQICEMEGI